MKIKVNVSVLFVLVSSVSAWDLRPAFFPHTSSLLHRNQVALDQLLQPKDSKKRSDMFSARDYELIDDDETFQLTLRVPGVTKDDIDVHLQDGYLTVRGQRKEEDEHSQFISQFVQTFLLDPTINVENITANLHDKEGMLIVAAPKTKDGATSGDLNLKEKPSTKVEGNYTKKTGVSEIPIKHYRSKMQMAEKDPDRVTIRADMKKAMLRDETREEGLIEV